MPVEQIAGQYQVSPKVFGDGETILMQVDSQGNLKTVGGGTPGTPSSGVESVRGFAYTSTVNVTRPANTTPYTANDVVGAALAALTFANIGPAGGGEVYLSASLFSINLSAIPSGMTSFQLALYNVTPPSALADGAAWDLPSGDRASFMGFMPLGTPADLGATLFVEAYGVNKPVTVPSGGSLYAYLITAGGYPPSASDVFKIVLKATGV